MSICYSSEADLCLLCSQLCLLSIFCLPEKNEHWGQSEKWGEGRQRRPNLKLQGRRNWITQAKQEVCSWDQPEAHSLSEGSGCESVPAHWHLQGWVSGREPLSGVSPLGWASGREPPPGVSPWLLQGLCCDLPALPPWRPLSCPPLFSSYLLSVLDSLGCYRPGWRLRHHQAFPPASEPSSPRPPPWELGWRGAWGSLLRVSFLAVSSIPDGGMRRATEDISEFPWMWVLHEPSLLIAESCCSKERVLYSY